MRLAKLFVMPFAVLGGFSLAYLPASSPARPGVCHGNGRFACPTTTSISTTSSTTTATTSTGTTTVVPAGYPASFFTGPAGTGNLLPPPGVRWVGLSPNLDDSHMLGYESYFGRKFKVRQHFANGTCSFDATIANRLLANGWTPMYSWSPPGYTAAQVNAGGADACIRQFGQGLAAWGQPILLRMYHEANGGWSDGGCWFSYCSTGATFISMWRHTVDTLKSVGVANASFVLNFVEGYYKPGMPASYPGDAYVDWVSSDGYNHNSAGAWCGAQDHPHTGWCDFDDIFHDSLQPGGNVEQDYRGVKPMMVAETGSVEGAAGQKGQWMVGMRDQAKAEFPGLYAIVYFDQAYTDGNWRLDTSTSSMDGFKALMQDQAFGG